jgi:hypothetical protein
MEALPIGTTVSPSGTSALKSRYVFLCSKNMTGSGSRIAALSRPLASAGVPGATTLRPTVEVKYASLDCEWYSAPCTPPPYGMRMTIGALKVPFDR